MNYLKIPNIILSSPVLSPIDKFVLAYIYSLHRSNKIVFSTNSYIAKMFGVSERTIQLSLAYLSGTGERQKKKLKEPFIEIKFKNNKRYVRIIPEFAIYLDKQMKVILDKIEEQKKIDFNKMNATLHKDLNKMNDTYFTDNDVISDYGT